MAVHAHKTDRYFHELGANNPLLQLFSTNDAFWWPYRSFAKALMETQMGASAYIEANRKLMNEVLNIIRKEQDLSLEICTKMMKGVAGNGGPAIPDASEVNAMCDRAIESMRELGEACMNAQMRSLDLMHRQASAGRKRHPARRSAAE